ncbi:thiamine-phosphate kinase [Corynebacterium freiburgense]|uniref:thiamine-phosphate kinase n=1 Tax=Corynebacterium freiburgense TaxID=556548 RepID=UPI0004069177|nr:thiamine-phosphate kinase [Corynebacterium freiburgense]WJZ02476.1 Thiamine-monophosphate kinase [Corynebacterium freiburgense]
MSKLTLGEIGERAAIASIIAAAPSSINGDDAAVLAAPAPNSRTVATTDVLVEGRHFRLDWSSPENIGEKAIVQNFADIEAMGARPIAALLGLAAPADTSVEIAAGIAHGIQKRASLYNAELIGGDLTESDCLVVSVTALGILGGSQPPLTLDAARPGQHLVAAGRIGYSAAGLALLQACGTDYPQGLAELVQAHRVPELNPGRGVIARAAGATSMTDNSDGLIVDLSHLAANSRVMINLFSKEIAPDTLLMEAGKFLGEDPWKWVLCGGEDHTLLATTAKEAPSGFRTIGSVYRGRGVTVDGAAPKYQSGWVSF